MPITPREVVSFWLDEVGPSGWYEADPALDGQIAGRFGAAAVAARDGKLEGWRVSAEGALAYLILTDQFHRNLYRGKPESFASDARARACASMAIERGWDLEIAAPARQFFYMPFVHSECMTDQDRGVCLMKRNMPDEGADSNLLHARAHREIIRRFSRFPFRNVALGRNSSAAEAAFMQDGGYMKIVRALQTADPSPQ